ncbi:MAG: hypothetical protein JST87_01095 [Bacteroidetes bacterium]|nr:hypothetical protein [Bacteroidota bacterium]
MNNTYFSQTGIRKIAQTISFYLIAIFGFDFLEKLSPSGPCTPGAGIMGFLFLPFIIAILLGVNAYKFFKGDKTNFISMLLHILALLGYVIVFSIGHC